MYVYVCVFVVCPCHYIFSNYTELLPSPIQLTSTQLEYIQQQNCKEKKKA